jgi:hypothetical protein
MPRITVTGNGIKGDPLNIALVGTEEEIDAAMLAAGWLPADPLTLRSSLRIAAGTVLRRSYETAPVSNLFVWGHKQDLAFQQSVGNDPRRRHHVRFWKSEKVDENGRPLWAGAATFDTSVGFSRTTGQITHHIDADVDTERDKLLGDLQHAGVIAQVDWLDGFHEKLEGRNGGGDPWHTDGRMPVAYLVPDRDESHVVRNADEVDTAVATLPSRADESPIFDITTKKAEDQVKVKVEKDTATFDVSSQSGIGGATITATNGKWPTTVILRLHLGGLESFAVSNGKIKLTGSVLSHDGSTKRLYLSEVGKEGERESGTEIKVLDAAGKRVKGLPNKGGYFEITLPKALLEGQPKSLEVGWIDFYRG